MRKWISSASIIMTVLCFTILPLKAEQEIAPKGGLPVNVVISYQDSTVTINWDAVDNAEQYHIYLQEDPYTQFTLIDSTASATWNGNFSQDKLFFYVTAEIMSFVLIPGGTFQMGDHFSEGYQDELPLHSVTVSDFYMGTTEVTQAEWSAYMPAENWSSYGSGDNYPAYYVSWYEIIKYCNLRSMAEGLTPCYTISSSTDPADWGTVPTSSNATWDAAICNWSANGYRLPTEAEWEYAARGGLSGQRFPNGAAISHSTNGDTQGNYYARPSSYSYDVSPTEGYHPDYNGTSAPVASFNANGYGLYDMAGNLYEWCWDWQDSYTSDAQTDPTGPATGSSRIGRGGGREDFAFYCRVAYRCGGTPGYGGSGVGFRLARTP